MNSSQQAFVSFLLNILFEMFLRLCLLVLCLQLRSAESSVHKAVLVGIKSTARNNQNHMVQKQLCGF